MSCLLSPHSQVISAATNTLKNLLSKCVAPHMEEIGPVILTASSGNPAYICKMFRVVEDGLSYRFHSSWPFVLQLLGSFYRAAGKHAHDIMTKSLQSLADLRSTPRFPFFGELDLAIGGAVESMGPEVVLKAVPLHITGHEDDLEFPQSWLIPVIRDHVKNTNLAYYTSYLLPLAFTLNQRAEEFEKAGQKLEAKVYKTLQLQIWSMLPGFCLDPLDLLVSFKGIARALGIAINERPELRMTVCQAIRTLITKSCNTVEQKAEMGRFAKNFLPIFFNVYSQQPPSGESAPYRMAILETIKIYLTVTDPQMVCTFLSKAIERLSSQDSTEFLRLSVMDLVVAMAPCVDEVTMSRTFELIKPYLENKEPHLQKKAYRVLEEMCGGQREECTLFVLSHLETLKHVLLGSLKNASSPAKRPRLKCLLHIVKQLNEENTDFITALLPEVIICTKEVSVGARMSAYNLLVEIGNTFIRFHGDAKDALDQYLLLIYVGLTGSVTMITCTVLALTRLVFQFRNLIGDMGKMKQLLHNVCLLLTSRTREIVKAALGFIKVILFIMDTKTLAGHIAVVIEGIGNMKEDIRRHFRMKLKNIFTKLIRKFGFELVKSLLPTEYHKVLLNIHKAEARTKRLKLSSDDHDNSDSDDDMPKARTESFEDILAESDSDMSNDEKRKTQNKPTKQKGRAWLKEGHGEEPLNFLDPTVSKRVLATNPGMKKSTKVQHGFKVTSDGRLIIKEEDARDKSIGDDGEMKDILKEAGVKSVKSKKIAFQDGHYDDEMEMEPQMKYKAGGSGIHRPLGAKRDMGEDYMSKKSKGDVKRKGKVDPYAYIPLKKAQLNRRKKAKMQGQFKGMVRGAQKGAQSGKKMHGNRRRT
ncbi:hypothetical protein UPYG_G00287950 [Umbra pygmaea]|uniref:RRP12 HEAT domain-containing protein n=1 Tax=Umbra pygmaea TaxID=75934 RepID=A0ABD0WK58_UMBPY